MNMLRSWGLVLAALLASGCMERPQVADGGQRKADSEVFTGADSGYAAAGWKNGDSASWEQQMKARAQGQNEYSRTAQP